MSKKNTLTPKQEKYEAMCSDCGKKQYTIRDRAALRGITVSIGTCPKCGTENTGIVPAVDWAAAEDERIYAEKYD